MPVKPKASRARWPIGRRGRSALSPPWRSMNGRVTRATTTLRKNISSTGGYSPTRDFTSAADTV